MRVGKKLNVVEAKKTRSCVVRLEKVQSPPAKMLRGRPSAAMSSRAAQAQDDKKFKGPLKKRPISHTTTPAATPKAKKIITPIPKQQQKESTPVLDDELPPTIAAGRSRRAIKPNPRYASEDMVTPKIIKHVGALASSTSKKTAAGEKSSLRKRSTSSSEDFFNKESSDELDYDDISEKDDQTYSAGGKDSSGTDISDVKVVVQQQQQTPRPRGRPKKIINTPITIPTTNQDNARIRIETHLQSNTTTKPTSSTPSQLQQLRKTFTVNRMPVVSDRKRKMNDSTNDITTKRFLLSTPVNKYGNSSRIAVPKDPSPAPAVVRRSLPANQTLANGNKAASLQPAEKTATDKTISKLKPKASPRSSPQNPILLGAAATKQRSSSPAIPKPVAKNVESKDIADKPNKSPSSTDDFEAMPTFTIVNINDIINKKGDVLISKTSAKSALSKTQKSLESLKAPTASDSTSTTDNDVANATKANRRKTVHTTILSEKIDAAHLKAPLPRTPFPPKKPIQTILNHTLLTKSSSAATTTNQRTTRGTAEKDNATAANKPAPRILNSMVAKKTQPVKPMIANLGGDDSADDNYALSLGEEEDMDVDAEDDGEAYTGKRNAAKKTAPATKENSLAATNRMPAKVAQHKLSPEKVVISRQGDKIVKKITCFETWYVINAPPEPPAQIKRNLLEIPLIKLANWTKNIKLPSDSWSNKVTLYELSAATLAKATLTVYTGDLNEHNIDEEDRDKYQPSCVMFRRAVNDRAKSRLPYDRAVIFKNKTFFTNIDGKNVKLIGAPTMISTQIEVEILLQLVDALTLYSPFVETATTVQ